MPKVRFNVCAPMLCTLALLLAITPAKAEEPTWKRPLAEKERAIETNIRARHNILGLYPSMVEVPPDGAPVDITTATPFSDVAHAVCWTSNYLAGASYRYRFLKESGAPADVVDDARTRADELFEAVYRCQRVTGVRGLQARGYFLGRGPVYEERRPGYEFRDDWHQGNVDGQEFRWRGNPSHHNYSDAIHGLGQYYDLAAEGEQKDRAREAIDALVSYWVDNDLRIFGYDRNKPPVPILGLTDGKTLNTRVMMVIAGAKIAHHATGHEKFKQVYDRLIEQYGVRGLQRFEAHKDFDDGEHVFCHLDLLCRIEDDPELLEAFRVVADGLWENHKGDGQSLFTYIYYNIRPEAPGRDEALAQAHRALYTWPTDTTIQPRMNSLRPDLEPPFAVYTAAWDNEYIWKGNLLRPDGWLSRIVTQVAVSPEDPLVLAAIDTSGDLYLSRDGAATFDGWKPIDQHLKQPVRAVAFGPRSRVLAVACDDGFYATTTAGETWNRLPLPDGAKPAGIEFASDGWDLYAWTTERLHYGPDFGEEFVGTTWEVASEGLPAGPQYTFTIGRGDAPRLYALAGDSLFTKAIGDDRWERRQAGHGPRNEYQFPLTWLTVDPTDSSQAWFGVGVTMSRVAPERTLLQHTSDAGASWSNDRDAVRRQFSQGSLAQFMAALIPGHLKSLAVVRRGDQRVFLAPTRGGILRSEDDAKTWQTISHGFEIPLTETVIAPRDTDWVFAGTPAGLFVSKDAGATWENGHLVLQFTKNKRRELGGAAFIDAYWRARMFGFLDDAASHGAPPEESN